MRNYTLPTLLVALCTFGGGCALQGQPETGSREEALVALEPHEVPQNLCACSALHGASQLWPEAEGIYRVTGAPGMLVLSVEGRLECHATSAELQKRPDLARLARLAPLKGEGSNDPTDDRDSACAGERGDSNPLPAAPLPDESADDSNPLPARGGKVSYPAGDSNPLPAREPDRHRSDIDHASLPTPLS